jgi:hypothetical protein
MALEQIVDCIFDDATVKKVLVVDKSLEFDEDSIRLLASLIGRRGLSVSIRHTDDFKNMHSQSSSILAIMKKSKEVVIAYADASTKPNTLPKEIHAAANKIVILYIHTKLKKLPYAKKQFDKMFVINNEDDENQYIRLTKSLLDSGDNACECIEDINVHDLNMVSLVLLQNVFMTKLPMRRLQTLYNQMAYSELFANNGEDIPFGSFLQAFSLMHHFKSSGVRVKNLDFTQHLSKYSIQSATKKKVAQKMEFLMSSTQTYDELLTAPVCCPELQDIQRLFHASLNKV